MVVDKSWLCKHVDLKTIKGSVTVLQSEKQMYSDQSQRKEKVGQLWLMASVVRISNTLLQLRSLGVILFFMIKDLYQVGKIRSSQIMYFGIHPTSRRELGPT